MPRVTRRRLLEAAGMTGTVALAGCSADGGDEPTGRPTETGTVTGTPTATETPTATATPRAPANEAVGFEAMLERTPTNPEMADESYVWARYVDVAALLGDIDDDTTRARLREGWLGSGPPRYTDSTAFELVHVQPGGLSNVTVGRGDYDAAAVIEGMVADDWSRLGATEAYTYLEYGGFAAAIGERLWIVVSDPAFDLIQALTAAVSTDPLVAHFDDIDVTAVERATEESGNYLVVQRSVAGDYAAGIALDYEPYRYPRGVLHYADGRESPSWQRVEHRFRTRVAGEIQADRFGEDFG